ncbi:MAG: hypothetical protein AAF203_07250, partial [Pseudomonadota bacterium]
FEESILLFQSLARFSQFYPNLLTSDFLSPGQVSSKLWLCQELAKHIDLSEKSILLLCGWYGSLNLFLRATTINREYRLLSVDIDPDCEELARKLNLEDSKKSLFQAISGDVTQIDYEKWALGALDLRGDCETPFDCVINTSCEHLENFEEFYDGLPQEPLLVLQSNNFFGCDGHVNCVEDLESFRQQAPMKRRLFQGELDVGKYKRFMLIGYKS